MLSALFALLRLLRELVGLLLIQLLLVLWLAFDLSWAGLLAKAMLVLAVPVLLLASTRRSLVATARLPAKSRAWVRFEDLRNVSSAVLLGLSGQLGWCLLALGVAGGVALHRVKRAALRELLDSRRQP